MTMLSKTVTLVTAKVEMAVEKRKDTIKIKTRAMLTLLLMSLCQMLMMW